MKIVHVKESEYDVYIGRAMPAYGLEASKWQNPFIIGKDGNREECIAKYETMILSTPDLFDSLQQLHGTHDELTLGCWCKTKANPNMPCHGDVLDKLLKENPFNASKKLAVIGSRDFDDYDYLCNVLDKHQPKAIISGGAQGADTLANRYAKLTGLPILIYYPDWSLGKSAGMLRNTKIISACEEVAAFWLNKSSGTADSIMKARTKNKKIYIYGS